MKTKSLVFKSSIVLSLLFLLFGSTLAYISFERLRAEQDEEMVMMEWTLHNLMVQEIPAIEKAKTLIGSDKFMIDEGIQQVQRQLNSMKSNQMIANSYIYMPDVETSGDTKKIELLLANQELYDSNLLPGTSYEATGTFAEALAKMEIDGYASSDVFTDEFGKWVSIVSSINDDNGNRIAIFGVDFDYGILAEKQASQLKVTIIIGAVLIILFVVLTIVLIRVALRPIGKLSELSKLVADGDLSVNIPVKNQDEVGILSGNFNAMISNIRQLLHNVQSTSVNVTASSNALTISAEQTSKASEEIASSIQEVASGSETQMQSAMESQIAMEEMAIGIQRIAESSSRLSERANEVTGNAEQGNDIIHRSVHEMEAIHTSVSDTVNILAELQQRSQEIGKILAIITNISKQTNLLALNASIEAARVGEHGKGFAVVANEVRNLAESSNDSSQQISILLNDIAKNVDRASAAMNTSMSQVTNGIQSVYTAGETFSGIVGALQSVSEQVHEVSAASEQMSAGSEQVAASLDELARIGRDASQNSQSVAASSEEQMAMMEEISSSATTLKEMANDLEKEIGKFKLE
ncbi:methyl-accepting chemotaxis protein [Paenibacillus sp. FA6]|uniref:methyl-accepting chemotaxis protein n=1 Tax=Paenibacillus sp. FA6 TaxID=3413029 RepID=UPI003F65E0AB